MRSAAAASLLKAVRISCDTYSGPPSIPFTQADARLADHIAGAGIMPYFALSWYITWFAHDVAALPKVARLFDLFMASHPLMPLYVGAIAIQVHRHLKAIYLCHLPQISVSHRECCRGHMTETIMLLTHLCALGSLHATLHCHCFGFQALCSPYLLTGGCSEHM